MKGPKGLGFRVIRKNEVSWIEKDTERIKEYYCEREWTGETKKRGRYPYNQSEQVQWSYPVESKVSPHPHTLVEKTPLDYSMTRGADVSSFVPLYTYSLTDTGGKSSVLSLGPSWVVENVIDLSRDVTTVSPPSPRNDDEVETFSSVLYPEPTARRRSFYRLQVSLRDRDTDVYSVSDSTQTDKTGLTGVLLCVLTSHPFLFPILRSPLPFQKLRPFCS